ncbi:MAG: DedA family protein [Pseudonocardiaceae bacterium]|nr:DedA family protein [Pseudonocardiaceae bacterium]
MLEFLHDTTTLLAGLLDSPWLWAIVFVVSALDALLPFMPSEATVITVGVLVHPHWTWLTLLVVLAAAGAFAGDCLGYLIGRRAGPRVLEWLRRSARGREAQLWANRQFASRGSLVIAVGRYLPGVRVSSMLTAGILRYPLRRFLPADAAGVLIWAVYAALIGYLGGATFAERPLYGLAVAFALALVLGALIELGRRLLARRRVAGLTTARR